MNAAGKMGERMNAAEPVRVLGLPENELIKLSRRMLLSLSGEEMLAVQKYFRGIGRNPTDAEIETIAQTWSEHCKHKTMSAEIEYSEWEHGKEARSETIDSLFLTYIKRATCEVGERKPGFLVSVFHDNAGVVSFTDGYDIAFKVETHNHPSALDPYGGANTGIGGVIRDILGCGLGAKPIANTDVFCFGPFDLPYAKLPKGILHPKRIAKGVRAGVRDYGNRMGIPTVNGAIIFDSRYIGNPLVYCGTIGIIPKGMHRKEARTGDLIVAAGAATGRDGIHGATFSSAKLSKEIPASVVQIGNAIEEKRLMDVLLKARDEKLYSAITDCGAGGFSSAVGEMGAETGAAVHLENAPLKVKGMKPWEIWLSESQERMVISVPPEKLERFMALCREEDVNAAVIGRFENDKMLRVYCGDEAVCELGMDFLHKGVPRRRMRAVWKGKPCRGKMPAEKADYSSTILAILAMPNIASKETTIRQYDHEVQGGSVVKPLVGALNDGPSDAAVLMPLLGSLEGVAVSCGINPFYGDIDPYWMAASAIDEALRNILAVGCEFGGIALLDNFCWGNPEDEGKLAELVRACKACYDFSTEFGTPFISGKDSFYNEYKVGGRTISIPSTLLVSAVGVMRDVRKRITMDLKEAGNPLYVVGETKNELGGSHYFRLNGFTGSSVPKVDAKQARRNFLALSRAMAVGTANSERVVRACHDCSEGGLAVALAEMCIAGATGAEVELGNVPWAGDAPKRNDVLLFSESNSRFIVEVNKKFRGGFEKIMRANGAVFAEIGRVTRTDRLVVKNAAGKKVVDAGTGGLVTGGTQGAKAAGADAGRPAGKGAAGKKVADAGVKKMREAWKGTLSW